MYVGVGATEVDGALGEVLDVEALLGVVSVVDTLLAAVVPLSALNDDVVAMTGATGMATNGTAMNAARMHGNDRRAPCEVRCFSASLE
jgi:hypothetical protein